MASISLDTGLPTPQPSQGRAQSATNSTPTQRLAEQASGRQELAVQAQEAAKFAAESPSFEEVKRAAADIADYISLASRSLDIRVDRDLQRPVITVVDPDTAQVIRQIPSEEALAIAKFIRDQRDTGIDQPALAGVILNEQG